MKKRTRVIEKVDVFNDSSFVVPGIKRRTRILEKVDVFKDSSFTAPEISDYISSDIEWPVDRNPLCDVCKFLRIGKRDFVSDVATNSEPQIIGSLAEISKRTSCPLCRLVFQAIVLRPSPVDSSILNGNEKPVALPYVALRWIRPSGEHTPSQLPTTWSRLQLIAPFESFPTTYLVPVNRFIRGMGVELKSRHINFRQLEAWTGVPETPGQFLQRQHREGIEINQDENQRDAKGSTSFPNFTDFRLIDAEQNCLIKVRRGESPTYFALSYVWGSSQKLLLRKSNAKILEERQSLRRHQKDLPRTIKDAIRITRRLRRRYLWVDALCIVQDDDCERAVQVHHMNKIYRNAELTIINASGTNSDSGFEGVFPTPRNRQLIEEVKPNLKLIVHRPMEEDFKVSIHQSRAWTYQERLSSRHCLIFLGGRVYFEHDGGRGCLSEDISGIIYDKGSTAATLDNYRGLRFLEYTASVSKYTERSLTHEIDILAAWAGVAKRFEKVMNSSSFWGFPTVFFQLALLWQPCHKLQRRKGFPSWSWAGWVGKVTWTSEFTGDLNDIDILRIQLSQRPTTIFYKRMWSKIQQYELVVDLKEINAAHTASRRSLSPLMSRNNQALGAVASRKIFKDTRRGIIHPSKIRNDLLPAAAQVSGAPAEWPYLHFWTYSAKFRLSAPTKPERSLSSNGVGIHNFALTDYHGRLCGSVSLDIEWGSHIGELVEVLILSACRKSGCNKQASDETTTSTKDSGTQLPLWNVMLIEWQEDNVAERIAIGQISKSALDHAFAPGKQWKEIALG